MMGDFDCCIDGHDAEADARAEDRDDRIGEDVEARDAFDSDAEMPYEDERRL